MVRELLEALQEAISEVEYQHSEMLTAEERAHPRGSGWARVYDKAKAALAKALSGTLSESRKPIVIEVRGGVVQDVLNVPPGYEYEVKDYDAIEAVDEEVSEKPKKTYRVKVLSRVLEFYEVEAASPEEAEELYAIGDYLGCDEEALDNEVVSVEEAKP